MVVTDSVVLILVKYVSRVTLNQLSKWLAKVQTNRLKSVLAKVVVINEFLVFMEFFDTMNK